MSTETVEAPAVEPAVTEPIAVEDEAYLEWLEEDEAHPCEVTVFLGACGSPAVVVGHATCPMCGPVPCWLCEYHLEKVRRGDTFRHSMCREVVDVTGWNS